MLNIIAGNAGRRGAAAIAITVVALILMASPLILTTTTTKAFAASGGNEYCNDIQFRPFESNSFVSTQAGNTITIGTSQDEYTVKIDIFSIVDLDRYAYYKNGAAEDPKGRVLLPGGKTITITLQTNEEISGDSYGTGTHVTLYNHKVSDCQTLFGPVEQKDKKALQIVSIEQTDESPRIAKLTVQVPDASEIKHFTKLLVDFPYSSEAQEYYLISHRVHVR